MPFKPITGFPPRKRKQTHVLEPEAPETAGQTLTAPFNAPLKTGVGKEYTGGVSDEDLHSIATEAGREGLHTALWGKNAPEHYVEDALSGWDRVNADLIGHRFREGIQQIDVVLERLAEDTDRAAEDALDAVDKHGDLDLEREELHLRMAREAIEPPEDTRDWGLGVKLGLLVVADLGLLSVAYQVLNLSDQRFLGIPFLSETGLSASGAVLALVFLAHLAGLQIRTGLHHLKLANRESANEKEQI
jgi:hypothetical protein